MRDFFKELFEYNHHCNQQLWKILNGNLDKMPEKSVQLYCHILNAHQIWNNRINAEQPLYKVWQMQPIQDCQAIDQKNFEHSLRILDSFELNDSILYQTTKGQSFKNTIRDTLFHVINHSTYHRAQIAAQMRQAQIEPMASDYIFYKR
jgi:uncharacterized damage-inducible protein DinB